MCGGGGAPPPPPLDPKAQELEQQQIDLLNTQAAQNKAYQDLQASNAGYTPIMGADPKAVALTAKIDAANAKYGNNTNPESMAWRQQYTAAGYDNSDWQHSTVTGYTKTEARTAQDAALADLQTTQMATAQKANDALNKYLDSLNTDDYKAYQAAQQELQSQQTQIALAQGERQKKALAGELPISQGTIDRKAQDFQLLKENLARGGNAIIGDDPSSAYSLSSPGVQALKEFNTRYAGIEDQERQGTLDSSAQTYLQSVGLSGNLGQTALTNTSSLSNPGGYAATSPSLNPNSSPVQNNLSLVQGYGSAMNPYLQQQQMQWQTGQNNAQIGAANQAGWLQLGGTVLGAAAGTYAAASNRRFKKNIEPIKSESDATRALAGTPVYRWNYKEEPDGHKKHLGTMTDEAPEDVVTEDGDFLDVTSYLGLLTLSAKDLHGRVMSLEGRAA